MRKVYNDRLVVVIKKPFDPFKSRTSYTIVMQFKNKFFVADVIKGLAEVKQNEISWLFLIDGYEKIINQHEELGFTRALLSEAMLELKEGIQLRQVFCYRRCNYVLQCFTKNTGKGYGPVVGRVRAFTFFCIQTSHQHPSRLVVRFPSRVTFGRDGDSGFFRMRIKIGQEFLNMFGCDCNVQHGSVCISTFLKFHMVKGAEAVRRLPTKNRLELFIKNSGFRGVVLMDRSVFAQRCNRGRILFGMFEKCFFVFCLEVRSFEATLRIFSRQDW